MTERSSNKLTTGSKPGADIVSEKTGWRERSVEVLYEAGLKPAPRCYRDYRFIAALLAGVLVVGLLLEWRPPFTQQIQFHWQLWLSLIIWQPVIEEILFRGILQGQLLKTTWGERSWLNISTANIITSILFVALHLLNNPPLFALAVFIPSLVFGYFRDVCNSVYPSMLLHIAYNAMALAGLFIYGYMIV